MASSTPRLSVEMIPSPLWGLNARSILSPDEWSTVRQHVYREADYHCEVCGGQGKHHPVEAHEVWVYDDEEHIQRIEGIIALCPKCHQAVHYGLSTIRGKDKEVHQHLKHVNGWDEWEMQDHITQAYGRWNARNLHPDWQVDMLWLVEKFRELTGKLPAMFREENP